MKITAWKNWGIFFIVSAFVPLFIGFHKMFAYESSEYSFIDPVNAYVGGDAYNYIINANYATGYFVLTLILVIAAIGCGVIYYLTGIENKLGTSQASSTLEVDSNNPENTTNTEFAN